MSSPASSRSKRNSQSGTPRSGAGRSSQASNGAGRTPRRPGRSSKAASVDVTPTAPAAASQSLPMSSPVMFRSSPMNPASNGLQDATPRASGMPGEGSSPIRYMSSSSPTRAQNRATNGHFGSDSSGLFVSTPRASGRTLARDRRGDVPSDTGRRQVLLDDRGRPMPASNAGTFSNLDPNTSEADALSGGQGTRILWGTNVSQGDVSRIVEDFLLNYERKYRMIKDGELDDSQQLPQGHPGREKVYMEMMRTMLELNITTLNLDMKNLKSYPPAIKLWHQMQDYPSDVVSLWDDAIKAIMIDLAETKALELRSQRPGANGNSNNNQRAARSSSVPMPPSSEADIRNGNGTPANQNQKEVPDIVRDVEGSMFRVRPFNLDESINMRDLNPADIDRVVSIKGLVIRTTPVIPDMKDAFFMCNVCGTTVIVEIQKGKISEPSECPREACKTQNSMQIQHNRCSFADKQVIKLQETPDSVPDGQTPHSVSVCAYNELVDFCKAGDRIEVTGIFKCNSVRLNPRQRSVKSVYKTFVDALHIQKVDKRRMGVDVTTIEQELSEQVSAGTQEVRKVSEEEEAKIKATAARPDVYELLSRSLAPSIYEMDDVKKGILLQLFGGTNKSFEKGGNPKYRGDINVLLCGDPSTSKSQLLQYVHKIAPRGVYTSGKGSSAVGLTAYITRDPETRQLVLESGALVLSDGGVCCIDEFDKMSDSTRSVLHEVMEQQTVSIAKAGIITTLNARTSILASANPIGSKYNPLLPVPQNIDLPPTLLSRFDLVYLVLDRIDEQNDRRLARHLVGMYLEDAPENASASEVLPVDFLTAYISYARTQCQPKITQAASDELVRSYVAMRKLGEDVRAAERRITATTRQLESMIRLAEAHAKMRLAEEVTADDVIEAVRLIKSALKQAATDSRTGLIDMGLLTEGTSASERKRKQDLKNGVVSLLDEMTRSGGNVRYSDFAKRFAEQSSVQVESEELAEALRSLQQESQLQILGEGARRTLRRTNGA